MSSILCIYFVSPGSAAVNPLFGSLWFHEPLSEARRQGIRSPDTAGPEAGLPWVGVLRENSVPTDFLGFLSFSTPCLRHDDPACGRGRSVSHSDCLRVVQSSGMGADSRVTTAARRIQAQVEEAPVKKPGPAILVLALKGLGRLDLRVGPGKTRDCDLMEEEEVSRVLAHNVPWPVGQTADFSGTPASRRRPSYCSTTTTGSLVSSVVRFEWRMQARKSRVDPHSMFGSGARWASGGYRSRMAHPTQRRTASG